MKRVVLPLTALAAVALTTSGFADANADQLAAQVQQLSAQTKKLQQEITALKKNKAKKQKQGKKAAVSKSKSLKPWPHYVTVTTTPFTGKSPQFSGMDLIYNYATINEDLLLLKKRAEIENLLAQDGYEMNRPIVQLSGSVAGLVSRTAGFNSSPTDGISLSTAELDINAIASKWANGFMAIDYNGAPVNTGNRSPNANLYLNRGFFTIGDLNKTPFYLTGGFMYVPFGRYATGMIDTPLTQSLGRVLSPTAELGFALMNGLHGSVFGYTGYRTTGGSQIFKQGGANLVFKHKFGIGNSYEVGTSWISNIADSQGMQNNGIASGGAQFAGFGEPTQLSNANNTSNDALVHNVDAADVYGQLAAGPTTFMAEYLNSLESFNSADMTFNGQGAKPGAMHLEMDYTLPFFPARTATALGLAYGQTWQALALNLPRQSYAVFLNTSIWRDTQESIEYRYNTNYGANDVARGRGATVGSTGNITGTSNGSNSILGQVSVFF